jgi:exosome complex component RRP45
LLANFNDKSLDTTSEKMPRETDPSNNAKSFLLQALRENVRIDGRGFDEFRALDLSFGDEYGVATVQLGKTRVMVRVSSEVVKASADRKFDGVFTISTELSPIASPAFEVGR